MFVAPAALERFPPGRLLRVVEVAVGTGTNTAALLEAAADRKLQLDWWGLERDPEPLRLALADPDFRLQWRPGICEQLQQLRAAGRLCWGDARLQLPRLLGTAEGAALVGRCDLVLLDAFSPRRCPQLWSQEFLGALARLLAPEGRLLTYCSAAAVRRSLQLAGLQLAAIEGSPDGAAWSAGTVDSPSDLLMASPLRPLSVMEAEHIACRAGEPYRDPDGCGSVEQLLAERAELQTRSCAEPASHWQRRWGASRRHALGLEGAGASR